MSTKVSKQVLKPPLDNNTIFARVPLYHKILKRDEHYGNDGYETADFLILKNKVIYRCYGKNPYRHSPGMDSNFYVFFSCQIFDVPDSIFDTPVIHELFEIVHFTSTNFMEIVYYRANGHKKYPFPNLNSSDKTLGEFLFEINTKQKIVLSHKTCQTAYAEFLGRQYNMMEEYNKLNPMRSIYHYVSLMNEYKTLQSDDSIEIELYKTNIKQLEENIQQLKESHDNFKRKYYNEKCDMEKTIEHLENGLKLYQEKCDTYEMANAKLQEKCDTYKMANAKLQKKYDELKKENTILQERTKILDESNF